MRTGKSSDQSLFPSPSFCKYQGPRHSVLRMWTGPALSMDIARIRWTPATQSPRKSSGSQGEAAPLEHMEGHSTGPSSLRTSWRQRHFQGKAVTGATKSSSQSQVRPRVLGSLRNRRSTQVLGITGQGRSETLDTQAFALGVLSQHEAGGPPGTAEK